ncbi:MAG TPA: hypothetical protein VGM87_24175 [Roseomonas sp.]|jgi:hypothetical protein
MNPVSTPLWQILFAAANPGVFLPALAIGWFCRSLRLALPAALAFAALRFWLEVTGPQMQGFAPEPLALPIAVLTPFLLTLAVFALRRWTRGKQAAAPRSIGPRLVHAMLGVPLGFGAGFVFGLVIGTVVVAVGGFGSSRAGAADIVGFAFILPGMLLGPFIGAVLGWFYPFGLGRKPAPMPPAAAHGAPPADAAITPGWHLAGIATPSDRILIGGLDPWQYPWRTLNLPPIIVAHPQYPVQRHRMTAYAMDLDRSSVLFAAGEFSKGVFGFYQRDPDATG